MNFDKNNDFDTSYMPYLNHDLYKDYVNVNENANMQRVNGQNTNSSLNQMANNYNQPNNLNNQAMNQFMDTPNFNQQMPNQGMNQGFSQGFNANMGNQNTPSSQQMQSGIRPNMSSGPNVFPGLNFMGSDVIIMIPGVIRGTMNGLPVVVPQNMNFGTGGVGITPYQGGANQAASTSVNPRPNPFMNSPMGQSTNPRPNNQPMNNPMGQGANQFMNNPMGQGANQPMNNPMGQGANQPMNNPMGQSTNQNMNNPMDGMVIHPEQSMNQGAYGLLSSAEMGYPQNPGGYGINFGTYTATGSSANSANLQSGGMTGSQNFQQNRSEWELENPNINLEELDEEEM